MFTKTFCIMKKKYEVIVLFLVFITVLFGCENK